MSDVKDSLMDLMFLRSDKYLLLCNKIFDTMKKENNLTTSKVARQNILNNQYALQEIQNGIGMQGVLYQREFRFSKKQVASFFGVEERTLNYYLKINNEELRQNGYTVLSGQELKEFISVVSEQRVDDVWEISSRTPKLAVFNFRAFLNLAMLLTNNDKARQVRSVVLDISISAINKRTGGGTKYINSRDSNYLQSAIKEQNYRKVLTSAINSYVEGTSTAKYRQITDCIYKAIFRENAKEYAELLKVPDDSIHDTMYAEVLMIIASFENGVGYAIQQRFNETRSLVPVDYVCEIIESFAQNPMQIPYLEDARTKMASRDYCFRETHHENISEYISPVSSSDFERFIGEHSDSLLQDLFTRRDVMKRLKLGEDDCD